MSAPTSPHIVLSVPSSVEGPSYVEQQVQTLSGAERQMGAIAVLLTEATENCELNWVRQSGLPSSFPNEPRNHEYNYESTTTLKTGQQASLLIGWAQGRGTPSHSIITLLVDGERITGLADSDESSSIILKHLRQVVEIQQANQKFVEDEPERAQKLAGIVAALIDV